MEWMKAHPWMTYFLIGSAISGAVAIVKTVAAPPAQPERMSRQIAGMGMFSEAFYGRRQARPGHRLTFRPLATR